jgi:hypothetical protein
MVRAQMNKFSTIMASRTYYLGEEAFPVEVAIFTPTPDGDDFKCEYRIAWPDNTQVGHAIGIDGIQAIILALRKLGADIYFAKRGKLVWLEVDRGFGLPLTRGLDTEYIGDDPP